MNPLKAYQRCIARNVRIGATPWTTNTPETGWYVLECVRYNADPLGVPGPDGVFVAVEGAVVAGATTFNPIVRFFAAQGNLLAIASAGAIAQTFHLFFEGDI